MIRKKQPQKEIIIDLTGPYGNAFALMAYADRFAKQLGLNGKEITNEENDQFHRAGFTEFIGSCPGKQFAGSSILLRMTVGEFVVFPYDMQHTVYPHFNENETRRTFPTNIDVYT